MNDTLTRPGTSTAGSVNAQQRRRHVELPPDPDQRVSLAHEEAVSHLRRSRRVRAARRPIEAPQHPLVAAIGNLEQQHAVAARGVDRLQDEQVGGEVHLAVRLRGGVDQVHDALVVPVARIDRELDPAHQLLVGPGRAERLPVGDRHPRRDGHLRDLGPRRTRRAEREQHGEEDGSSVD